MKYLDFLSRVQIGSCRFENSGWKLGPFIKKRANTGDSFPLRFIEIGWSFRSITMRHARIELSPLRRRYLSRWLVHSAFRPSFDPSQIRLKSNHSTDSPKRYRSKSILKLGEVDFTRIASTIATPIARGVHRYQASRSFNHPCTIRLKQIYTKYEDLEG